MLVFPGDLLHTMGSQIRTKNHPQNLAAKYVKDSIPFPTGEGCLSPAGTGFHHLCMYQVDVE